MIENEIKNQYNPIDLHCHSTYSDGAYIIKDLLDLAKKNGGKHIALTDHDTVEGICEAKQYASILGLNLISGVEISVTWEGGSLVHILGLNIDENNQVLLDNLKFQRSKRFLRGQKIAAKLAKVGIKDALEGALKYCSKEDSLSRTHFSRFLVEQGYANPGKAFTKYLAPGKPGYVSQEWASLEDAINWIIRSGGIAVIAHPCRYNFTRTKLLKLITQFKDLGGQGIEVITPAHSLAEIESTAIIAQNENLLASVGSDFHNDKESFRKILLGINHSLPKGCIPIYPQLGITDYI